MADFSLTRKCPHLLLIWFTIILHISPINGNAIVQGEDNCGSLTGIPNDVVPYVREPTFNVTSHAIFGRKKGYLGGRTCVLTVRGKQGNQWSVNIRKLHIDRRADIDRTRSKPRRCHDYLKIYDGPRADGARLMTPATGLCGKSTDDLTVALLLMRTCQNYVTFEFSTDNYDEDYRGFVIVMTQEKWRNRGSLYRSPLIAGASSSCIQKEFQVNWRKQVLAKGEVQVGDVEKHAYKIGTFWCYECNFCNVDYFEPKQYPSAAKAGCYMCLKQHNIKSGTAKRVCFTERDYIYFMDDIARQGSDIIKDTRKYVGCFQHTNVKNQVKQYCFCEGDYCNKIGKVTCSFLMVISLLLTSVSLL